MVFLVCFIFILKKKAKKPPNNWQYEVITITKTHNDTPPMPCTSLEAEKAPFPLLTLFSLVVNKNKKVARGATRLRWLTQQIRDEATPQQCFKHD